MVNKRKKGIYIVLSSPSGAGKTTLAKELIKKDKNLRLSISYTTRKKRPNEKNKKDYCFVSEEEFNDLKNKNKFIEWARVFNNFYGTSYEKVKELNDLGNDILFDIDWQGARKIKKVLGNNVISIFILPPSKKELIRRLKTRAQDPNKIVQERLSFFKKEVSHWKEYQYVLINDRLKETVKKIETIIKVERIRISKDIKLPNKIKLLIKKI